MKVIIPLAGFGTRLRPHTFSRPKPLISVAGKPVLGHILDLLAGLDVEEMVFIIGHLGDQIETYVQENYGRIAARYVEQKELKGQAHAIWLAREAMSGPVLIIFVDTIFDAVLAGIEDELVDGILYVKEVEDPRRFGVAVTDEAKRILKLVEKPDSMEHRQAVVGVYYVRRGQELIAAIEELLEKDIQTKGEYYLADALQVMIDRGGHFVARQVSVWEDAGKPETVLQTNRYLLDHGRDNSAEAAERLGKGVAIVPPVYIHQQALVEEAVVGPYVTLGKGAVVRRAVVRNSIVEDGSVVEDTVLAGSLIGQDAQVRGRYQQLNVGDTSVVETDDGSIPTQWRM